MARALRRGDSRGIGIACCYFYFHQRHEYKAQCSLKISICDFQSKLYRLSRHKPESIQRVHNFTMGDDDIDAQLAGIGKELDKDAEIDRKFNLGLLHTMIELQLLRVTILQLHTNKHRHPQRFQSRRLCRPRSPTRCPRIRHQKSLPRQVPPHPS